MGGLREVLDGSGCLGKFREVRNSAGLDIT